MTLMHWAMFLLGLTIGLAFTAWTSYRMINEQIENLRELQSFIIRYNELTDAQYNNLQTYVDQRFDSFLKFTDSLSDIVSRMSRESNENGKKLVSLMETDHHNKNEMIRAMSTALSEYMEANTERWDLIVDYITNENDKEIDYCVTCRNNNEESIDTCLTCSEGAMFKHDPEHVYSQTEGMITE